MPQTHSVLQCAAFLLLFRIFLFLCSGAPFTAAYAAGMFLAAVMQALLMFPLLRKPIPKAVRLALQILVLLWGARLAAAFFTLYNMLRLPHAEITALLLLPALLYTAAQHDRAAARAGTVLLAIFCLALLLLPISGIRTAQLIALHEPDSIRAAFLREWQASGELLFIPLLRQNSETARSGTACWFAGKALILPAIVLFGTMQNTRLLQYAGSPFFLLLARTPLSDAVRTDGLWMLLAFGCGLFCMAFCLQTAKPHTSRKIAGLALILLPFSVAALILYLHPQLADACGILCSAAGILLPYAAFLVRRRTLQTTAGKETV